MTGEESLGGPGHEGLELRIRQLELELEDCRKTGARLAEKVASIERVGHELNNLWTAIAGSLELIDRKTTDAKLRQRTSNAAIAVTRGAGLTERLLALSQGSAPP